MCIRVDCKQCGKYSWSGCGKHLATIYGSIDKGKHCMCRPWPGVIIPTEKKPTTQPPPKTSTSTTTTDVEKSSKIDVGLC
ncbi:hypothetical protein MANES_12G097400v8 [Manihot esculenta]|uniref:Uncharacterized protein n=1 Tax=Manihot esculenta TaxID=3983 RepID=A0A2C9UV86_MANES|nr:hypothetical protein MANES_12G097400v8 [Manihot esculenta]